MRPDFIPTVAIRLAAIREQTTPDGEKRRDCAFCGKPVHRARALFCNRTCFLASIRSYPQHFEKPCVACGQPVMRDKQSTLDKAKYCSFACYWEHMRAHPELQGAYRSGQLTGTCPVCGKAVLYYAKKRRAEGEPYCSRACALVEFGPKVSGSLNWHFKGDARQRGTATHLARKYLGNKCAICGWAEAGCDAHHIEPVKQGGRNALANMIILCPNHHRLANVGKLSQDDLQAFWEARYSALVIPDGLL